MHSREQKAALERLAADLRRIRTQSDKTLTEVHEDTRIPLEVLRRLETDLLAGDTMFNDVYLRSILRGFARAVNHDEALILQGFEEATSGTYSGSLAVARPETEPSSTDSPDSDKKGNRRKKKNKKRPNQSDAISDSKQQLQGVAPDRPANAADSDPAADVDSHKRKRRKGFVIPKFDFRKGGIGVLVLVAVATGIYGVNRALTPSDSDALAISKDSGNSTTSSLIPGAPGGSRPDDTVVEPAADSVAQTPTPFVFPDTVSVAITTISGVFDPIRVRIDRDLRRPYWADEEDTLTFRFTNRIIFEEQADRLKLLVLGKEYPLNGSRTSFTLTRAMAEDFLTDAE